MNKLLILGANGFVGKHLQEYIVRHGLDKQYEIIGADIISNPSSPFPMKVSNFLKINELDDLLQAVKPEYILNLAGILQSENYEELLSSNAGIARNILELISRYSLSVKKIVLIGSAAEYGKTSSFPLLEDYPLQPINYYGLTKAVQSQYAQYYYLNHNIPICVARIFNIIGKNKSTSLALGEFRKQIIEADDNGVIYTGNLQTERDFVFIDDVMRALFLLLEEGRPGEIYNVCNGAPIKMQKVLELMIAASGKKLSTETDFKKVRKADIPISYGSYQKLLDHTGWSPTYNITMMVNLLDIK